MSLSPGELQPDKARILSYRSFDEAERKSLRQSERRARSLGIWMTVSLVLGAPGMLLLAAAGMWLLRDGSITQLVGFLPLPILLAIAGVAFLREVVRGFILRPFLAGMLMGLGWLVAMVASAWLAAVVLNSLNP